MARTPVTCWRGHYTTPGKRQRRGCIIKGCWRISRSKEKTGRTCSSGPTSSPRSLVRRRDWNSCCAIHTLTVAEAQELLKQKREAASAYQQIINEKLLPRREEELHVRLVDAFHLAGDYNESDNQCRRFFDKHLVSALLPTIMFRHAENAY